MNIECAYSFEDLYVAAFHQKPQKDELPRLYALPHEQKNKVVEEWVKKAGWETKVRIGTDGLNYIAFAPKF